MSKQSDFVQRIYQAGLNAGLTDAAARVMAAQAGVESTYGDSELAQKNNFFGIKGGHEWNGPTITRPTVEGAGKNAKTVDQPFRVYSTPEEGIANRVKYMDLHFPGFSKAPTVGQALDVLQHGVYGKYYTADRGQYEGAVKNVIASNIPEPTPPLPRARPATAVASAAPRPPVDVPNAVPGAPKIIDLTQGGTINGQTIPANASKSERTAAIKGVVFHHTGGSSLSGALQAGEQNKGATYYIDTDGQVYRYAPDNVVRTGIRDPGDKYRTDKGKGTYGLTNNDAISVEVVGADSSKFTPAQKAAAAQLGGYLATTYKIDPAMIVGHGDIQGGAGGNKMPTEGVDLAAYVRQQVGNPNSALSAINTAVGDGPGTTALPPMPRPRPAPPSARANALATLGATAGDSSALGSLATSHMGWEDTPGAGNGRQTITGQDLRQVLPTSAGALARLTATANGGSDPRLMTLGQPADSRLTNSLGGSAVSGTNGATGLAALSKPTTADDIGSGPGTFAGLQALSAPLAAAPVPSQSAANPFGFVSGGLASLGAKVQDTAQNALGFMQDQATKVGEQLPTVADKAKNAIISAALMSPEARGAFINPMISGVMNRDPLPSNASFADRQARAAARQALIDGTPAPSTGGLSAVSMPRAGGLSLLPGPAGALFRGLAALPAGKPALNPRQLAGVTGSIFSENAVLPDSMNNSRWLTGY